MQERMWEVQRRFKKDCRWQLHCSAVITSYYWWKINFKLTSKFILCICFLVELFVLISTRFFFTLIHTMSLFILLTRGKKTYKLYTYDNLLASAAFHFFRGRNLFYPINFVLIVVIAFNLFFQDTEAMFYNFYHCFFC